MTKIQLDIRRSQIRQRLGEIAKVEKPSTEERAEVKALSDEAISVEVRYQAAAGAEPPAEFRPGVVAETVEQRELRELHETATLSGIVRAVVEDRATSGPESELQAHYGIDRNRLPLAMLRDRPEIRTSDQTAAPTDTGASQAEVVPYLFERSATRYLGVANPTVPVGERVYPVLSAAATIRTPAGGAEAAVSAATFTGTSLEAKRIQASVFYRLEDAASLAGMEAALRMHLGDALMSGLDKQVVAKFTSSSGGLTDPGNPSVEATFADYAAALYGDVDSRFAMSTAELSWLVRSDLYAHMGSIFSTDFRDNAASFVGTKGGGLRVSNHVIAATGGGDDETALIAKSGGMGQNAVAPVWEGIRLVRDEVTQLDEGEVKLGAIMLYNVAILRADGFARREFQVA